MEKKLQCCDARPLARDKVMYNRVIDSIVYHQLEACLLDKTKLEILSEILTKIIYGDIPEPLDADYDGMLDMLKRYTRKIIEDCRVLSIVPLSEFEPPEPLSLRMLVLFELEKWRRDIFTMESQYRKSVDIPQDILEKIAEKIWSCKVRKNINADKYSQLICWANRWFEDRRDDIIKELYEKKNTDSEMGFEEYEKNDSHNYFDAKINYPDIISKVSATVSPDKIPSKSPNILVLNITHEESEEGKLENDNKTLEPNTLTTYIDSFLLDVNDDAPINKNLLELVILMKQRDLLNREYDEKILKKLEDYRRAVQNVSYFHGK